MKHNQILDSSTSYFANWKKLAVFVLILAGIGCQKGEIAPIDSGNQYQEGEAIERNDLTEQTPNYNYKYYLDGVETTQSAKVDECYYSAATIQKLPNETQETMLIYGFSSKEKYHAFSDANNLHFREHTIFAERMEYLADSAGLTENSVIPSWYEDAENSLEQNLFPTNNSSSAVFGLTFYDFWSPIPLPIVFNPGPVGSKPVMAYPAAFPYAWGNIVSSIKPLCFQGSEVVLHDKIFYKGARRSFFTTANQGNGASGRYDLGGFWNNRASSFAYFLF